VQKLLLNYSSNGKKAKEKREDFSENVSDLAFAQDGTSGGYTGGGYVFNRIHVIRYLALRVTPIFSNKTHALNT
jgi:hypothetical protein